MHGIIRLTLSALFVLAPSLLAQGNSQPQTSTVKQETPQSQKNPATQANLPNAPSSLITGKPHRQGKIPLEDIPHPPVELKQVPLNIIGDTYRLFTSPVYIRSGDLKWMLPIAAATGIALSQDTHVAKDIVSHDPGFNNANDNVSYDLLYSYIAGSVTMFGVGALGDNGHLRETGLLSGESQVDAEIFDTIIKLATFRERPTPPDYSGKFYQTSAGADSSFISGHAILTWSAAAAIAAEYPSPWKQVGVYSGATATALTRVLAERHFPTDVLLGSAAGWMIGHYVVRAHHCHPIYRHNSNQPPDCAVRTR
jgi:PAP2 superfamily